MISYKYPCPPLPPKPRLVALGFFDGVHKGHRALLLRAKEEAERRALTFSVFTFSAASDGYKGAARLFSDEEKAEALEALGVEELVSASFRDVAALTPRAFVGDVIVGALGCRLAVAGTDYRFGSGARGDAALLARLMREQGGGALFVPEELAGGEKISTTRIKNLLSRGDPRGAAELLGAPFSFSGHVVSGLGLGHEIGMPTVNVSLPNHLFFLKHGVYASALKIGDKFYTGLTNVGCCPTFGARDVHTETYIANFSGELYGSTLKIYLLDYLREERSFESATALTEQVQCDERRAAVAHKGFEGYIAALRHRNE